MFFKVESSENLMTLAVRLLDFSLHCLDESEWPFTVAEVRKGGGRKSSVEFSFLEFLSYVNLQNGRELYSHAVDSSSISLRSSV